MTIWNLKYKFIDFQAIWDMLLIITDTHINKLITYFH